DSKPTFDCSGQGDIPNLELDVNCNYEEPVYKNFLSNFENFTNEPFIVKTSYVEDKILRVKIQGLDGEGGEVAGECNLQFYLFDNIAPIFNCPSSTIEISPNHEAKYILPDFGYLAEDNCDENLVITQNPLPGEITANPTVVIAARDRAGNTSNTCIFSVVLTADPQPTFQCPSADEIQLFLDDNCNYVVGDYRNRVSNFQNFTSMTVDQNIEEGTEIMDDTLIILSVYDDGE